MNAKTHGGQVDPDPAPRAYSDRKTMADLIAQEQAQDGAYNAKLAERKERQTSIWSRPPILPG